ncbi:MAG: hypothetical protein ACLRIL_09335 [Fusicatenibacter saccharivorans]
MDIYDRTHQVGFRHSQRMLGSSYELTNYLIQQGHTKIGFVGTVGRHNQYFRPVSRLSAEHARRGIRPEKMG